MEMEIRKYGLMAQNLFRQISSYGRCNTSEPVEASHSNHFFSGGGELQVKVMWLNGAQGRATILSAESPSNRSTCPNMRGFQSWFTTLKEGAFVTVPAQKHATDDAMYMAHG